MAYIGKSPTGTGVRQRYYFTATGGETTLGASADDNGLTLSYSDGAYVDVLLNGIELVAGTDYNTTTANRISGLASLSASDVVTVTVYDIFTVADTVSAKDGGTFSSNVTFNGNINAGTIKEATGTTTAMTIDGSGIIDMPTTVMYDTYRLTANFTTNGTLTAWEQPDNTIMATVGDSMSVSSGIFTFPRTGIYRVTFFGLITNASGDNTTTLELFATTDNSTYSRIVYTWEGNAGTTTDHGTLYGEAVLNISDISNRKVKLEAGSTTSPSQIIGNTDENRTYVSFQYLAPST